MKILVAPLNWGLGHASRCIPLIYRFIDEGHEVILGGDGDSLLLLRKHFPKLRYVYLAPLRLRYSSGKRQVWAIASSLPHLFAWSLKDHAMLRALLHEEHIDRVISDNRFGLYNKHTECIYITHQLHICLPSGLKWAENFVSRIHAFIYRHYDNVWIPDKEIIEQSLAGALSHPNQPYISRDKMTYIGHLSRFQRINQNTQLTQDPLYDVVAVLSGLEPQRSLFEKEIVARYIHTAENVLLIQGLISSPSTRIKRGNITVVPYLNDEELRQALLHAKHIIARSGYSTIMDLEALGVVGKAELIPTPGQPEQEYLATWLQSRHLA